MNQTPGEEKGEDFNVREIHAQIIREKAEPHERWFPIPGWLKHAIYWPLTLWSIWYVLLNSGGFQKDVYVENKFTVPVHLVAEAEKNKKLESGEIIVKVENPLEAGEKVYKSVCMACHQENGQGLAGAFPPLANSDWVAGDPEKLILLVLHGLNGEIKVNGVTYNGVMPAQGSTLKDKQIAAVLTYVRASWGNEFSEVSEDQVKQLRAEYKDSQPWTAESLNTRSQ